jgi:hypothetical protein
MIKYQYIILFKTHNKKEKNVFLLYTVFAYTIRGAIELFLAETLESERNIVQITATKYKKK